MENLKQVVNLPSKKPAKKAKPVAKVSARQARRTRLQHMAAALITGVAAAMTAVSLQHIAGTFIHQTGIADWQAWSMATGIDVNYVGMELAGVVAATQGTRDKLHKFTKFGIPAIMLFSQACNVLEFTHNSSDMTSLVFGAVAGVMLPVGVWLG